MDLLKNTQFLKLWGNQILLQVAFNMTNFTCLLVLDNLTHSRFMLALFYSAMTLPAFFVGAFAGSIVDISDRKRLMLTTDLLISLLFLGYALFSHFPIALLAVAAGISAVSQFFTPSEAATIPLITKAHQLERANALFLFTGLGSVMIGYSLAGPLIDLFGGLDKSGVEVTFVIAAIMTFIGFLLRFSLATIENERPDIISQKLFIQTIHLTKEMLYVATKSPRIYIPIILLIVIEFNIGILSILFLDFVKTYLKLSTTATSYFLVLPLIIGLGVGVAILSPLQKRLGKGSLIFLGAMTFCLILVGLGTVAFLWRTNPLEYFYLRILTAVCSTVIGISLVFIAVQSRTILQEQTPKTMLGRIFSLVTIGSSAIAPIPVLIVSLITQKIDVALIFIVLGTALGISSLIFSSSLRKLDISI